MSDELTTIEFTTPEGEKIAQVDTGPEDTKYVDLGDAYKPIPASESTAEKYESFPVYDSIEELVDNA